MHVGDSLGGRQWTTLLAERLDRRAVDILHHDEPFRSTRDEVVYAHDVGVFDCRQKLTFGHRGGRGRFVGRVEQSLEHHPAIEHRVRGEIDPAQSPVGQAAFDLVLVGDDFVRLQRWDERIRFPACRTKSHFAARQRRRISLGVVASGISAEPLVRRHLGVRDDHAFRCQLRQFRHRHQSQSDMQPRTGLRAAPAAPLRTRAQTRRAGQSSGSRATDRGRACAGHQARGARSRHGGTGIRWFQATSIAKAAVDRPTAARLRACRAAHSAAPYCSRRCLTSVSPALDSRRLPVATARGALDAGPAACWLHAPVPRAPDLRRDRWRLPWP